MNHQFVVMLQNAKILMALYLFGVLMVLAAFIIHFATLEAFTGFEIKGHATLTLHQQR